MNLNYLITLSGLEDGTIAIWSPLKKNEQKRHQILSIGAVYDVAVDSLLFSHDGCFLASLICDSKEGNQLIIWSTSVNRNLC
jgi:WD40 repeat protein